MSTNRAEWSECATGGMFIGEHVCKSSSLVAYGGSHAATIVNLLSYFVIVAAVILTISLPHHIEYV